MSESSKYEAQKKKLEDLCAEHDLTYRFRHDSYPITLRISPLQGMEKQLSMLEEADTDEFISPDASMEIYRKDAELMVKINGTFTMPEALRNKFKNIYTKLADFWLQYFYREVIERDLLHNNLPVISENEADDAGDEDENPDPDAGSGDEENGEALDETLIKSAISLLRQENKATVSMLQRRLKLGYSRASRLMQELESRGIVGPYKGSEPREVLPFDIPEV